MTTKKNNSNQVKLTKKESIAKIIKRKSRQKFLTENQKIYYKIPMDKTQSFNQEDKLPLTTSGMKMATKAISFLFTHASCMTTLTEVISI